MQERTEGNSPTKRPVVIIGGGAAGLITALKLADKGYPVNLFEKDTLGQGASGRNPGRMGHGFHYTDVKTALAYLHAGIGVQKKYPNYLIGPNPQSHLRHGRYFITKNSDTDVDTILKTYEAIKQEYKRLVELDPSNEVFGPPDSFYRILKPEEYANDVNMDKVAVGVETNEALFNWQAFLADLRNKIVTHKNITLHEHTEVTDLQRNKQRKNPNDARFVVEYKTKSGTEQIATDTIVNSAWENIEYLNDKLGIPMQSRTNRVKALLRFTLPEPYLSQLQAKPSMFFCMGKFCMISNMGDGTFLATAAEETNIGFEKGLTLSKESLDLINGKASTDEKEALGRKMINIIASFVPLVAHAQVMDVKFGIVRTQGNLTLEGLSDPNDPFRLRADHCVVEEQQGLISNPLMKLFYFNENSELVEALLDKQMDATEIITRCFAKIQLTNEQNLHFDATQVLEKLESYSSDTLTEQKIPQIVAEVIAFLQSSSKSIGSGATFFKPQQPSTLDPSIPVIAGPKT